MRRLLGEHFKRNGRPKAALTREEARAVAFRDSKRAYLCSFCGHWHVGGRA